MSKIVRAVNTMILNKEKIGQVILNSDSGDYYFIYDDKFNWSINYNEPSDNYIICYYPGDTSIESLATIYDWSEIPLVSYATNDLKTKEAYESFQELFRVVKEKLYGVDSVLDDIISGEPEIDIPF